MGRGEAGEENVELEASDDEEIHVGGALELLPQVLEDEVVIRVPGGCYLVAAELLSLRLCCL